METIKSPRGSELITLVQHFSEPIPHPSELTDAKDNVKLQHWYVASPFSSDDCKDTEKWVNQINLVTAFLIEAYPGVSIFTPVSYTSSFAHTKCKPPGGWYAACLHHLEKCNRIIIVALEGWEQSIGIAAEVGAAYVKRMKISMINPEDVIRK